MSVGRSSVGNATAFCSWTAWCPQVYGEGQEGALPVAAVRWVGRLILKPNDQVGVFGSWTN